MTFRALSLMHWKCGITCSTCANSESNPGAEERNEVPLKCRLDLFIGVEPDGFCDMWEPSELRERGQR